MDGNSKILVAFAIVGFISGVVFGKCRQNLDAYVIAYGMSFLGAYLLLFGISSYIGGFHAKKWSIYLYVVLMIIIGGVRGHFMKKEAVSEGAVVSKSGDGGAFDGEDEAYSGAMGEGGEYISYNQ